MKKRLTQNGKSYFFCPVFRRKAGKFIFSVPFADSYLEDVQLEVAVAAADGHGNVVSHDLGSDHSD